MATSKALVVPATTHKTVNKLSTSNYIALFAVVGTLVVLVGGFVCYSLGKTAVHNTKVLAKKYNAEKAVSTKLDNAPKLVASYQQLGDNKRLINDALPNDADFPQLITIMSSITSSASVNLLEIAAVDDGSATAPATSGPVAPQTFSFRVTTEGSYAQIVQFMHNVEQSARPMRITTMTLGGTSNDISASFNIQTYYQGASTIDDTTEVVK